MCLVRPSHKKLVLASDLTAIGNSENKGVKKKVTYLKKCVAAIDHLKQRKESLLSSKFHRDNHISHY